MNLKSRQTAMTMIPAVVAIAGLGLGGTASATAASALGCTSNGNIETCMDINASGPHITFITISSTVLNSARTLAECIRGPAPALPKCTSFRKVGRGDTISLTWSSNANEPAGTYCAETIRRNSDGSQTDINPICVFLMP